MKSPHYFCENCGAEVPKLAKVCPRCGRFFSSVKCPKCGFVGVPDDFDFGCPDCGYAEAANAAPEPIKAYSELREARPVPWWAYLCASLVIIALLAFLLIAYR
jgi:hypothetical protein